MKIPEAAELHCCHFLLHHTDLYIFTHHTCKALLPQGPRFASAPLNSPQPGAVRWRDGWTVRCEPWPRRSLCNPNVYTNLSRKACT